MNPIGYCVFKFQLCIASFFALAMLLVTPALANLPAGPSCATSSIAGLSCASSNDPGVTPIWKQNHRYVGNPVDVVSGNKYQREQDYQAIGSRLHFSRYYSSALSESDVGLGHGWRHSYMVKLIELDSDRRQIVQADGRTIEFKRLSATSSLFMAHSRQDGYIEHEEQARWFVGDGRILSFYGSHLVRIDYSDGASLQLMYNDNQLQSVTNEYAQQLLFEYTEPSAGLRSYTQTNGELDAHLKAVSLPSGERLLYRYDAIGNLTSVATQAKQVAHYEYNDTVYPNHLTDISGPKLQQRRWTYNRQGMVESYTNATTQQQLTMTYYGNAELDFRGETLVEHRSGKQEQFHWQRNAVNQQLSITRVDSQSDESGSIFSFSPVPDDVQQADDVLKAHTLHLQTANTARAKPKVVTEMTSLEDVDLSAIEVLPIAKSLNSQVVLRINGSDLTFEIHADRNGKVTQITFGNTSLREMAEHWASGDIVRCDAEPLFQRALQQPKPDQSCIEDFVFLVELSNRVTELNQSGSYNDLPGRSRRSATTGTAANQPCLTNPFASCTELERNFELAQLTSCAYKIVVVTCGQDWESVDPATVNLTQDDFNYKSFSARLFLNNQTGEYVLAFRGTDDRGDWKDNLLQAVGVSTSQYRKATELAEKVKRQLAGRDLSTAGHSLGGGLATAAALQIEVEGHVFNPAALVDKTADRLGLNNYTDAERLVSVTTMHGDLLTSVQNWVYAESAFYEWYGKPSTHTRLSKPDRAWLNNYKQNNSSTLGFDSIALHSIESILQSNEATLKAVCGITASRA